MTFSIKYPSALKKQSGHKCEKNTMMGSIFKIMWRGKMRGQRHLTRKLELQEKFCPNVSSCSITKHELAHHNSSFCVL